MTVLYEDKVARALLAENAAAHGHVLVQPVKEARKLSDLSKDESEHFFLVASYTAAILFQGLQAEGTNIIINEEEEQLTAHVIARKSDDGLDFQWDPQEIEEGVMTEVQDRIKDKTFMLGKTSEEIPKDDKPQDGDRPDDAPKDEIKQAEEEENYLIKQLIRTP